MCEIIFVVKDKNADDPYVDVKAYKRGDVVIVQPDGWQWGSGELTDPLFRIAKLPNVTEAQANVFLSPEVDIDPQNPSRMLQRRGFYLDVSDVNWPAGVKTWFQDDTRAQPTRTFNQTPAQILAFKKQRPVRPDPAHL